MLDEPRIAARRWAQRVVGPLMLLHARRPADRALDERGWCQVCGEDARFVYNSSVLPNDLKRHLGRADLVRAYCRRESLFCTRCLSSLRARCLARAIAGTFGSPALSMPALVDRDDFRALRIAEVNALGTAGSLHRILSGHPGLVYSEFMAGVAPGDQVGGVRNEDVTRLSYRDAEFDLVLHSETLEHVPDVDGALLECRRVLRPGGRLIFTVPLLPPREVTLERVVLVDGEPVLTAPAIHHGRGSGLLGLVSRRRSDFLCWRDFGTDLLTRVERAGFEARFEPSGGEQPAWQAEAVVVAAVPGSARG